MTFRLKRREASLLFGVAMLAILLTGGGLIVLTGAENAAARAETAVEEEGPPPAVVRIARARAATLAPLAEAPGSAVSIADSLIAAATTGKVAWIAEVGTQVEEGDVIARLDPADAEMARDEAQADIGRLTARATYLASVVRRYETLGAENGEPEMVMDEMRANRDQALQDVERARVALARAETNLDRTRIRAPFTGRIASREIQVGEFAGVGAAVARLVDTTNLEVTARAPASILGALAPGDLVEATWNGETVTTPVRAVVPVGDDVSRTLELRVALPQTGWPIGAAVRVRLATQRPRRATAAPRDALVLRADRVSVFKVDAGDIARRIDVDLGAADGDLIEVIGDVSAGDRLVIRGGERLRDGQAVIIQNDDSPQDPVS